MSCPQCGATLRTAADTSVEGPCPTCGTTIRYVAPDAPAPPAIFVPRKPQASKPDEPEFEKPRTAHAPRRKEPLNKRTRHWLRLVDDFFYSRAGRAISCAALAALFFYGVVLFFKWDKKRRAEAIDLTPPPAVETAPDDPERP